jgi:hypothetical protein
MNEPMTPIIRKLLDDALQLRRVRVRTRDSVWPRDPWLIIDDKSRRRDEAFARKLRDWKRRYRDSGGVDCRLFFEVLGPAVIEGIEHNLAARKLVRDFFTERARRAHHGRPELPQTPDNRRGRLPSKPSRKCG